MYAIIMTGGKQYRVAPGDIIQVEIIPGEIGDSIELDQVLMVAPDEGDLVIGRPRVDGARVVGSIIGARRGPKLIIQKFKRRKRYRTRTGYRQDYRQVRINSIELPS